MPTLRKFNYDNILKDEEYEKEAREDARPRNYEEHKNDKVYASDAELKKILIN